MQKHKFISSFACNLKPMVSLEFNKYLSKATEDVKKFLPNINVEDNIDLLPVAFNACVVNRANKNGDIIDTQTALDIAKNFINRPINVEHSRQKTIGVILNVGFSELETGKILTNEEASTMVAPFYITMGAVLWRIVNPEVTDRIEESGDPQSDSFQSISASWELGFSEYDIAVSPDEGKDLEGCSIITDASAIASLDNFLKSNGGTGKIKDGRSIFRKIIGKVVPLGIGLTENPAAEVKGIAVKSEEIIPAVVVAEPSSAKIEEKISQSEELVVNTNSKKFMKIESVEQINEANWKEISVASVTSFIAESLKKANDTFLIEKHALETTTQASAEALKKMQDAQAEVAETLNNVQAELSKMKDAEAERSKVDSFNSRMNELDASFELPDEVSATIASQVKNCTDEASFEAYKTSMSVFLKPFQRKDKKNSAEPKTEEKKVEATASIQKETAAEVVDRAVDGAKKENISLPNSMETKKGTLIERYSNAFSLEEGFVINPNRR